MQSWCYAAAGIRGKDHIVVEIEGGAGGSLNAHICRDATDHDRIASSTPELQIKFGTEKMRSSAA